MPPSSSSALPLKPDEVPVVEPGDEGEGGAGDDRVVDPAKGIPIATDPGEGGEEDAADGEGDGDNREGEPGDDGWGDCETGE